MIKSKIEFEKYKNGITKEQAVKLKQQDLQDFEKIVKDEFKDTKLTQNQYDALVMRAYNAGGRGAFEYETNGSKAMVDYIKAGKDTNSKEFNAIYQKLNTSKGLYNRGVENRRKGEKDLVINKRLGKEKGDETILDEPII